MLGYFLEIFRSWYAFVVGAVLDTLLGFGFLSALFFFFFEWGVHQRETGTGSRLIDSVLIEVITRLGIKAWGTGIEVMHLYIFVSV